MATSHVLKIIHKFIMKMLMKLRWQLNDEYHQPFPSRKLKQTSNPMVHSKTDSYFTLLLIDHLADYNVLLC